MSDGEATATAAAGKESMSQQDIDFLLTCIKNTTGGVLTVDANKIATALNYQNPRSVTNKISILKKKYGLAISTAGAKAASNSASAGDGTSAAPAIPKTPAPPKTPKGKVIKAKATPKGSAKKTPIKKVAKSAAKAEDDSEEADADEEMEDAKESLPEKDEEA